MASMLIDLRVAWMSLLVNRRRAVLLGTAIAGVAFLFVVLDALSSGIRSTLMDTVTTLSVGHLNVGGFLKVPGGQAALAVTDASKVLTLLEAEVSEADFMVLRGRGMAKAISDSGALHVGLRGVDIARERDLKKMLQLVAGRVDDLEKPSSVLLFEDEAKKLKVSVGDAITIAAQTARGVHNAIDLEVVAVARDIGLLSKSGIYLPAAAIRKLLQYDDDTTGAVHIYLRPASMVHVEAIAERIRRKLHEAGYRVMDRDPRSSWLKLDSVGREGWKGQKLDVASWEDELSFLSWPLDVIGGLGSILMTILLCVVVTGIMSTMWIAIRERRRELGSLRAIGMQRLNVVRMLLVESLLLGLAGSSVGALSGALASSVVSAAHVAVPTELQLFVISDELRLSATPHSVLWAVVVISASTCLAALYPAFSAARLRPVEAMSHFG